jgi:hypothetical protein
VLRGVISLVVGGLALCVPTALLLELSGADRVIPGIGFLVFAILYFAGFGMLGGFVAAVVAGRREVMHTAALAAFVALMIVISLIVEPHTRSIWSSLVGLFVAVPAVVLGGFVRGRIVARSARRTLAPNEGRSLEERPEREALKSPSQDPCPWE